MDVNRLNSWNIIVWVFHSYLYVYLYHFFKMLSLVSYPFLLVLLPVSFFQNAISTIYDILICGTTRYIIECGGVFSPPWSPLYGWTIMTMLWNYYRNIDLYFSNVQFFMYIICRAQCSICSLFHLYMYIYYKINR